MKFRKHVDTKRLLREFKKLLGHMYDCTTAEQGKDIARAAMPEIAEASQRCNDAWHHVFTTCYRTPEAYMDEVLRVSKCIVLMQAVYTEVADLGITAGLPDMNWLTNRSFCRIRDCETGVRHMLFIYTNGDITLPQDEKYIPPPVLGCRENWSEREQNETALHSRGVRVIWALQSLRYSLERSRPGTMVEL